MRDEKIDIAKGIGIILVVLGHCSIPQISSFVYLFHMPLFFLISGYLYHEDSVEVPTVFLKKKLKGLYIPYVTYEIIFTLLRNKLLDLGVYSTKFLYTNHYIEYLDFKSTLKTIVKDILLAGREPLGGTLWFSVVLLFVNILFLCISKVSKVISENNKIDFESVRQIFVIALFIFGNLSSKLGYTIPRCNNACVMVAIFYIGVLLKRCKGKIIYRENYVCIAFLFLILNNFYGHISVNSNEYLSPAFLIVNCLLGVYLVMGIATYLVNCNMGRLFGIVGRHSFSIMVLHYSAFMIVSKCLLFVFKEHNLYEFPILNIDDLKMRLIITVPYLIVGTILPLACAIIYGKIKNRIKGYIKKERYDEK